jgi:hypothetical protein
LAAEAALWRKHDFGGSGSALVSAAAARQRRRQRGFGSGSMALVEAVAVAAAWRAVRRRRAGEERDVLEQGGIGEIILIPT